MEEDFDIMKPLIIANTFSQFLGPLLYWGSTVWDVCSAVLTKGTFHFTHTDQYLWWLFIPICVWVTFRICLFVPLIPHAFCWMEWWNKCTILILSTKLRTWFELPAFKPRDFYLATTQWSTVNTNICSKCHLLHGCWCYSTCLSLNGRSEKNATFWAFQPPFQLPVTDPQIPSPPHPTYPWIPWRSFLQFYPSHSCTKPSFQTH